MVCRIGRCFVTRVMNLQLAFQLQYYNYNYYYYTVFGVWQAQSRVRKYYV